jgi:hypothetical protein
VPDGLNELRRRRAIQLERLEALDREIAELEGNPQEPEAALPPVMDSAVPSPLDAEAIMDQYREPPAFVAKEAKRGCLLLFIVAMGLLFAALGAMYIYIKSHRGP